ncbi:MAG: hypothetical protein K0R18_149 [Bacillales bacterium]|jgi:hypothetical protein|nr:hypothetical protein [Bacillales bacterium]
MFITSAVIATGFQVIIAVRVGISTFKMVNVTLKKRTEKKDVKKVKTIKE